MGTSRIVRCVAVIAAVAAGLAACGGDDDGGGEGTASTAEPSTGSEATSESSVSTATSDASETSATETADTASGTTESSDAAAATTTTAAPAPAQEFKVMVSGDFTSPVFASPEAPAAAASVLSQVPGLEIIECDTKGDPNEAQSCERRAVDEGVVAVLNSLGVIAAGHEILNEANIPVVGYVQETVPNAFAVASGIGNYAALGVGVAQAGCTRVATIYIEGGASGGETLPNIIRSGAEMSGAEEVARAGVPNNAPDLSAPIAKLLDADPECIILSLPPTMVVQAVTAIKQAGDTDDIFLSGVNAIFAPETLEALGPLAEGILIPAVQLDPADDAPVIDEIRQAMAAIDDSAPVTSTAVATWASARLLATAFENISGEITPAATLDALNALRDVDLHGAMHDFSAIELSNPVVKRSFNHYAINYVLTDGTFVRQGDFYDIGPVLDALSF